MKGLSAIIASLILGCMGSLHAEKVDQTAEELMQRQESQDLAYFYRGDNIPLSRLKSLKDALYFEGYIQALVDSHYYDYSVLVRAKDNTVFLYNLPKNELLAKSIVSFVADFPGVEKVVAKSTRSEDLEQNRKSLNEKRAFPKQENHLEGIWMPQQTVLFAPLIADPRQISYSIGYRFHDTALGSRIVPVSFGDNFPIFRWMDVGPYGGDLQIGIEAGVWAVFGLDEKSSPLINADYFVSFPLTYAYGQWSYRLRFYHLSSHLGDEYLIFHPQVKRLNVSFEAIEGMASYQLTDSTRVYGGMGVYVHSDKQFKMKHLYASYGAEVRLLGQKDFLDRLYLQPFFAMHFSNSQYRDWDLDQTYALGVEFSKLQGIGRKMRLYTEIHKGFCEEGQLQNLRSRYISVNLSYGF